jgi:anti-sigma factor RsiW
MNQRKEISGRGPRVEARGCEDVRSGFSGYLDGAVSGVEMAAIATHLEYCGGCAEEFAAWRSVQRTLGQLGPARPPARLQARLREAIAVERERGAHLSFGRRALLLWESTLAPFAVRLSGGLAAALVLAGGLTWMFAAPLAAVQASDSAMANLVAPRYLYSQVPPQPIVTHREEPSDVPIVVEAMVDSKGRVYDYTILAGPHDADVRVRVEDNLLSSIFKPATVFGVPVRGHVVMTYDGVSVRG